MSMTLKEFSKTFLKPVEEHEAEYEQPIWQKAFPANLRTTYLAVTVKDRGFFSPRQQIHVPKVEEEWVRIHAGQVIDREWRTLSSTYELLDSDYPY